MCVRQANGSWRVAGLLFMLAVLGTEARRLPESPALPFEADFETQRVQEQGTAANQGKKEDQKPAKASPGDKKKNPEPAKAGVGGKKGPDEKVPTKPGEGAPVAAPKEKPLPDDMFRVFVNPPPTVVLPPTTRESVRAKVERVRRGEAVEFTDEEFEYLSSNPEARFDLSDAVEQSLTDKLERIRRGEDVEFTDRERERIRESVGLAGAIGPVREAVRPILEEEGFAVPLTSPRPPVPNPRDPSSPFYVPTDPGPPVISRIELTVEREALDKLNRLERGEAVDFTEAEKLALRAHFNSIPEDIRRRYAREQNERLRELLEELYGDWLRGPTRSNPRTPADPVPPVPPGTPDPTGFPLNSPDILNRFEPAITLVTPTGFRPIDIGFSGATATDVVQRLIAESILVSDAIARAKPRENGVQWVGPGLWRSPLDVFRNWWFQANVDARRHVRVGEVARAAAAMQTRARIVSARQRDDRSVDGIRVSLVATGRASGEVFRLELMNPSGRPVQVAAPDGLVLEAIKPDGTQAPSGSKAGAVRRHPVIGYCVDFAKPPPVSGMLFRLAPPQVQQQFQSLRAVLRAGRRLAEAGRLRPDSDPRAYVDAIKQWAVWTRLEKWDVQAFTEHFVARTKENARQVKQAWTRGMEEQLRASVPNRWRDITAVLDEARALEGAAPLIR